MAYDFARSINVVAPELYALATLPVVYFTATTVSIAEGSSGSRTLTLTARRSSLAGALAVSASYVPGTADASDFIGGLPGNKTFLFIDGSDTATIDIAIRGDLDVEGNETFGYRLEPGDGYRLGTPSTITGTIINDDVTYPPASFTMSQLATPNRVYQRDIVDGVPQMVGTVPVTMNVTSSGSVYARTRAVTAGNPVIQASRKVLDNVATGTRAVAITGITAQQDEFLLDLSPDGTTWTLGTTPIGMGKLVGYAGQSLMEAFLYRGVASDTMASAGETPTTLGRVCTQSGTWMAVQDDASAPINGAGVNVFIRLQAAQEGCRIGLVGYAQGATEIAYWLPGQTGWTNFAAAINAAGNRIEAMLWMQGHSDSAKNDLTGYYYRKQLSAFFAAVDALVTDQTFARYVTTIPNISSTAWGPPYKKEAIRVAGQRWCEENLRAVSVVLDDLSLHDGTHQDQAGSKRQGITWHRYMVDPATAIGATFGAVSVAGNVVTVPLILPTGATNYVITGDFKARLAVFPHGLRDASGALAIDSVALGAASGGVVPLKITLTAAPGDIDLDVIFNPKNDPAADGSAIVLRNDLTTYGGAPGRSVTSARPVRLAAARPVTLNNSPAYSAGRWSGHQGLSAGAADTGFALSNWASGWTVEMWIKHNGSTGTLVFLLANGGYYGFSGDDLNIGGTAYANVLPRNVWHHVAVTNDAGVTFVHVDGALVSTNVGGGNPPNETMGIRGFFNGGFRPAADACVISDVAVWVQSKYGPVAIAVPTGPYTGSEPGLDHLWPLDGSGADTRVR